MSRILVIQNSCIWNKGGHQRAKAKRPFISHVIALKNGKSDFRGRIRIGLSVLAAALMLAIFIAGAFYLYQVNSIATKGYEVKDIEKKIQESEKEINKLKIMEVELKSMYNIEKATEEMNLITTSGISYLEVDGPVAMK